MLLAKRFRPNHQAVLAAVSINGLNNFGMKHRFTIYLNESCTMYQGLSQDFHNRVSKMGFQEDRVQTPSLKKKIIILTVIN